MKNYYFKLIGEFLVIFLGILMAFFVDRWWEEKQERKEEKFILESITNDLKKGTSVYNSYQIPLNENKLTTLNKLSGFIINQEFDSLDMKYASAVMGVNNWPVTRTSFNVLKETGQLKIIKNKKLRGEIINYYEATSLNSDFANESHLEFFKSQILSYVMDNANLTNPRENIALYQKRDFLNRLILLIEAVRLKTNEYRKVSEQSEKLLKSIESVRGY